MSNMAEEFKAELLETSQEDELSAKETSLKSAGDVIVEGKRAKKSVDRLDFQAPKHKELTIGEGSGDKLGDIPRTNLQINKLKPDDLKPLHVILFERPGKVSTVKKNLRLFNGFPFPAGSEQYIKKREKLLRASHLTNAKLKVICSILDLEKKGTHSDMVDRILTYLISPKNSGKQLPAKKKKRSKKNVSAVKSAAKGKKSDAKAVRSSSSPKKSRAGSKSKATVMDSSTDDEEHDEEEKAAAAAGEKSSEKEEESSEKEEELSEKDEESSEKDKESSEQSVDEEEDEEVKKPKKRSRTPAKKTPPPRKRFKAGVSDDDLDSEDVEKKKKPAARTKKADSSSRNTNTDDTSDEDEPLSRMVRRAPSDKQLKETVHALLKDADLEEMTMKQICQRVFDTYADHDLSGRKNFIKQSVKSLIT
ncbi:protein DEK-like isoform X2 [Entelurus aequoreus]|uniref:protein DEK-like isoform X2 n=1 Tax=Entelurus aequoreus TaxID=161455 RepID=UPI002B1D6F6E|nr:protein DEK-like isoform X2 [Entelurus aequoreus]XP_061920500.1 protein DEK-like isoform X2 [Entelurus aequoreus]